MPVALELNSYRRSSRKSISAGVGSVRMTNSGFATACSDVLFISLINESELAPGAATTAPIPTNDGTAAQRKQNGCVDEHNQDAVPGGIVEERRHQGDAHEQR